MHINSNLIPNEHDFRHQSGEPDIPAPQYPAEGLYFFISFHKRATSI